MAAIRGNAAGPVNAVLNVYINHEKKFAFVEMRSVEEASNVMALNGIMFEGAPVKVRRPTDYNPSLFLKKFHALCRHFIIRRMECLTAPEVQTTLPGLGAWANLVKIIRDYSLILGTTNVARLFAPADI
jgi:hypothetical protein